MKGKIENKKKATKKCLKLCNVKEKHTFFSRDERVNLCQGWSSFFLNIAKNF